MPSSDGTWEPTKCKGTVRNGENKGNQCPLWAMRGGEYCHKHGGRLPNMQKRATRNRAQKAAELKVIMYGLPRDVSPAQALLEELHRTQGHVDWLHNIIVNMDDEESMVKGIVEEVHRSGVADEANWDEERVATIENIWVRMYFRERKHLLDVAKTIMGLGLAQQMVHISKQQADTFDKAIVALVLALGHDINDDRVRAAIADSVRTVVTAAIPLQLPA